MHVLRSGDRGSLKTPTILTTPELALKLKVSETTVQRYCRAGRIPFLTIGNEYRFVLDEVIAALRTEYPTCQETQNKNEES